MACYTDELVRKRPIRHCARTMFTCRSAAAEGAGRLLAECVTADQGQASRELELRQRARQRQDFRRAAARNCPLSGASAARVAG